MAFGRTSHNAEKLQDLGQHSLKTEFNCLENTGRKDQHIKEHILCGMSYSVEFQPRRW